MKTNLESAQVELLREAISKQAPSLLQLIHKLGTIPLTLEELQDLRLAVSYELAETGVKDNGAENSRGLLLDDIITDLWYLSEDGIPETN